jgi:hypothetical protein
VAFDSFGHHSPRQASGLGMYPCILNVNERQVLHRFVSFVIVVVSSSLTNEFPTAMTLGKILTAIKTKLF